MQNILRYFFGLLVILSISLFSSCRKNDKVDSNPALMLSFSTDTVMFDTVFATVGSVTQRLMVYNRNSNKISISQIQLGGGAGSSYRINVDGTPALTIQNVQIAGKDSMFIFIRVTVNPNDKNTAFIVSDSIIFQTNGNRQVIQLAALGQNADFNVKKTLKGNQVWDSLKAHVIYGYLRIDTGALLTILPGAKIYLHKNAYIAVSDQASLIIGGYGQWDHPVRIQSDRFDPYYRDLPGQWDAIYFERGSKGNSISNAVIKNGNYGLILDSLVTGSTAKLILDGTIIQNMVYGGIYAYSTSITGTNCVIGNCGGAALWIEKGGSYDFRQLTIGNFWTESVRSAPALYLSNFTVDSLGRKFPNSLDTAYFGNCIIYGSSDGEIQYDSVTTVAFSHMFDHCLLKTGLPVSNPNYYIGCFVNQDPRFLDVQNFNYRIDSISPAINKGVPMGVPNDITGRARPNPDTPALGAYEYAKTP
jgi:hypothetical protein